MMAARRGIRVRITVTAVAAVALVLAISGVLLVVLQRNALTDSIDQGLVQRADDMVALIDQGELPSTLAQGTGEGFAQYVGSGGEVIAATANLVGVPPLGVDETGAAIRTVVVREVDDDEFRVLTRSLTAGTLHVGTTYDVVGESTAALVGSLSILVPALIIALGVLVWWFVGRTLRPVESITTEVASFGPTELDRRVPRPQTGDEIDRLAETMNLMLERVEESVARQTSFVADASHELRTPLTRLRAHIELGLGEADDAQQRKQLQLLLGDVVSLQELVDDLLYLARADAGSVGAVHQPFDFDDVVLEEANAVAATGMVDVDISGVSGAQCVGDSGQLRRAVRNLLVNAERHATSKVVVTLDEHDGQVLLSVEDDGPGVPASQADRIFDRFGRLDEARGSETGGAGLGLAIAADIARLNGGTLELVNPGSAGARFEMRLPTHTWTT